MSCLWKNIEGRGSSVSSHARSVCASSQSDTSLLWKDTKNNSTWGQQSDVSMINPYYLCPLTSRSSLLLTTLSTLSSLIDTFIWELSNSLILSGHWRLWREKVKLSLFCQVHLYRLPGAFFTAVANPLYKVLGLVLHLVKTTPKNNKKFTSKFLYPTSLLSNIISTS